MEKNIVLIGFMATGKSSLGRQLAKLLSYKFIDTDLAIEEITGKTVEQIFRQDGATRFRSEENLLVQRLSVQSGMVIATGGGMVLDQENAGLLQQSGIMIGLRADPEVIVERVKNKKRRPLLRGDVRENVYRLLQEREGAYDIAEITVDTGKLSFNESLFAIYNYIKGKEKLGK